VAGGIPAIVECFELLVHGLSIRLVFVVVGLYLILIHAMSVFSLPLTHYGFSSRLQLSGYSQLASAFSLPVSIIILNLTISEFISWTTNLRKQIE
jgi:hypothetical protein